MYVYYSEQAISFVVPIAMALKPALGRF